MDGSKRQRQKTDLLGTHVDLLGSGVERARKPSSSGVIERKGVLSRVLSFIPFGGQPRGPQLDGEFDHETKVKSKTIETKDRFFEAIQRIQNCSSYAPSNIFKAPYGYFGGRFIIGEKTRITGGVYVCATPHECLVIDPRYGSLNSLYQRLIAKAEVRQISGRGFKEGILSDVCQLVQETLRYSPDAVTQLAIRKQIKADQKVALDLYIEEGIGVARHHVLLAGYLLERLRDNGFISGSLFIDAQSNHPAGEDERLIYANSGGGIFILDPRSAYLAELPYCREMNPSPEKRAVPERDELLH